MKKRIFKLLSYGLISASIIGFVSCEKEETTQKKQNSQINSLKSSNEFFHFKSTDDNGTVKFDLTRDNPSKYPNSAIYNGVYNETQISRKGVSFSNSEELKSMKLANEGADWVVYENTDESSFVKAVVIENIKTLNKTDFTYDLIFNTESEDLISHNSVSSNYISPRDLKDIDFLQHDTNSPPYGADMDLVDLDYNYDYLKPKCPNQLEMMEATNNPDYCKSPDGAPYHADVNWASCSVTCRISN